MVLNFLLLWSRLNLFSLFLQQEKDQANSGISFEATTYFEYGKIKKGYQTKKYLLDQIKSKVLSIREALYLPYELLFMFDNAISHTIYVKDTLQETYINKGPRRQ